MQRRIVLGLLVIALLGVGVVFGAWKYRQGRPDRQWIPVPINPESTREQRDSDVAVLREALLTDEIFAALAAECNIATEWKLPTPEAAAEEVKRRAFIEIGESPVGGIPTTTLNIGFKGTIAEQPELRALALGLIQEFQKFIEQQAAPAVPAPTETGVSPPDP